MLEGHALPFKSVVRHRNILPARHFLTGLAIGSVIVAVLWLLI